MGWIMSDISTPNTESVAQRAGSLRNVARGLLGGSNTAVSKPNNVFHSIRTLLANGSTLTKARQIPEDRISYKRLEMSPLLNRRQEVAHLVFELVEDKDWGTLADLFEEWDQNRAKCPAGYSIVGIAVDAFRKAISAPEDGAEGPEQPVDMTALAEEFEVLASAPNGYPLAALAIFLRVWKAWEVRGKTPADNVTEEVWAEIDRHFQKADWMLTLHNPRDRNSAMLAQARFALCDHMDPEIARKKIVRFYSEWIELDPMNMAPHAELSLKLLPCWFGNYEQLESAARQAISGSLTGPGAAPYTVFYLTVFWRDDRVYATLDTELFAHGLNDLLELRKGDQFHVAQMIGDVWDMATECGELADDRAVLSVYRAELGKKSAFFRNLARKTAEARLTSIMPKAWNEGETTALACLADLYRDELAAGATFKIDQRGLKVTVEA